MTSIAPRREQKNALVLIDVQKGFLDSNFWGERNNSKLVENIQSLLKVFRRDKAPIIHVQHLSTEEKSPLRPGQQGSEFIEGVEPCMGERIFQKSVNSAFIGTNLEEYLKSQGIESLTLCGLTSDHCVSTTARMASNLGFQVFISSDCTATFERKGLCENYPAELVHAVSLASLNNEFAVVTNTEEELLEILKVPKS